MSKSLPRGLYAIVDPDQCGGRDPMAYAEALLAAGVKTLQLRDKSYRGGRALSLGRELGLLCERFGALFVVNDRVDVALLCKAAVHLGPDDLPLAEARKLLGPEAVIGRSTNEIEEALRAAEAGADYLAFGPLFETRSKTGSLLRSRRTLRQLKEVVESASRPVYAIGGVAAENVADVAATGAAGVAVIGALAVAKDLERAVHALQAPWSNETPSKPEC